MSFDADAYRAASLRGWEEAAPGWVRSQDMLREFGAPVSHWLIDAIVPQPGQRVLELAAGLGETGMLAAELVAPAGGAIVSDQAEAMLAGARGRAVELRLSNVEFLVLNAESIDLPVASVDAVVCRWGYMLMADPLAALRDTTRGRSCQYSSCASAGSPLCRGRGCPGSSRSATAHCCASCSSRRASSRCAWSPCAYLAVTRASPRCGSRRSICRASSTTP